MKTKEELNQLKSEFNELNQKLAELNDDELEQVTGGGPKLIAPVLRLLLSRPGEINDTVYKSDLMSYIPIDSDSRLSK